jgi:hypothetical protein
VVPVDAPVDHATTSPVMPTATLPAPVSAPAAVPAAVPAAAPVRATSSWVDAPRAGQPTDRLRYKNMASEYELPSETHACSYCGAHFYKVPLLNEHMKAKHPNFDAYKKLVEAERAAQGGDGSVSTPAAAAVTAETIRSALERATSGGDPHAALQTWLEVGIACVREHLGGPALMRPAPQSVRMEEHRAHFAAAGLQTLDDVRALTPDAEAALVAGLQLPLGPKKVGWGIRHPAPGGCSRWG